MKPKALAVLIAATLMTTASAQLRPTHHFTLNSDHLTQAIVKALSDRGIATDATHIALLGSVISNEPDPALKVLSIQPLGNNSQSSVKLSCHPPSTCLPFYALIHASPLRSGHLSSLVTAPMAKPPIAMRTGAHATLLLDDGRASLQLSVISLESGLLGHTIRVRTPDRKRIYSAQILNANTLEARF